MMNRCKRWRYSNNAFGYVLSSNVARVWNNAFRFNALGGATGSQNTAIGDYAGFAVITGSNINAIGTELSGVSSFFWRGEYRHLYQRRAPPSKFPQLGRHSQQKAPQVRHVCSRPLRYENLKLPWERHVPMVGNMSPYGAGHRINSKLSTFRAYGALGVRCVLASSSLPRCLLLTRTDRQMMKESERVIRPSSRLLRKSSRAGGVAGE